MSEIIKGGKDYVGYDYKTINVDNDNVSMMLDAYKNFGWTADNSMQTIKHGNTMTIKLKRDRKILNKVELTRLQQHFEACIDEIALLEKSKTKTATIFSIAVALLGTVFLASSVFAVTNESPLILLCILLGIPGIVGWVLPYFIYKYFSKRRAAEVIPIIEQKYDEIHGICEKGNALIH